MCVRELEKGDSETIYTVLKEALLKLGVFEKIVTICTDGAQVMISQKNGLVGKLKTDLPHLFNLHCIAHRLNLAVSDTFKEDLFLHP